MNETYSYLDDECKYSILISFKKTICFIFYLNYAVMYQKLDKI